MKRIYVDCPDCRGTQAEDPDCGCCEGAMEITVATANEWGYAPANMTLVSDEPEEEDWYCCPVCHGNSCQWCMDSDRPGKVPVERLVEEEIRVLRFGLDGELPRGGPWGDEEGKLSRAASARCREKGWTHWWVNAVTGDEISLTDKGRLAVLSIYDDGTPLFLAKEDRWSTDLC